MSTDQLALMALKRYYTRHLAMPSFAELGAMVGLTSKSSVGYLVLRLKHAGYLSQTPSGRIAPTRAFLSDVDCEADQ